MIKKGSGYVVIEGNTRIAAYKILTGLLKPPHEYANSVPHISEAAKKNLLNVDCSIAPDRDALMPIMASAHFGMGDKSKWGYLGSRKAVFDEWKSGKNLAKLAKLFKVTQGDIKDLILEYQLYLKALNLPWTAKEKEVLLKPDLAFNPPVRFLQTSGHKDKIGITYDTVNLKIIFAKDADKKFKHLLKKLVINPVKGLGATATYEAVFADYGTSRQKAKPAHQKSGSSSTGGGASSGAGKTSGSGTAPSGGGSAKHKGLFVYPVTINNGLLKQL